MKKKVFLSTSLLSLFIVVDVIYIEQHQAPIHNQPPQHTRQRVEKNTTRKTKNFLYLLQRTEFVFHAVNKIEQIQTMEKTFLIYVYVCRKVYIYFVADAIARYFLHFH